MSSEPISTDARLMPLVGERAAVRGQAGAPGVVWACIALLGFGALWWAAKHVLPDHLSFTVMGHAIALHANWHTELKPMLLLSALLAPGILAVELVAGGWRDSSLRHLTTSLTRSSGSDIFIYISNQLGLFGTASKIISLGIPLISGVWINHQLSRFLGFNLTLTPRFLVLQCILYIPMMGFLDYWSHRLQHTRYFWPLHRFHHAAEDFYVLTSDRVHPADVWWRSVFFALPAAMLGAPAPLVAGYWIFGRLADYLRHARLDWDLGWFGRYIVQSPVHHRLHHGLDEDHRDCNFGAMPLWDHVFGTWRESTGERVAVGVVDRYDHGVGTVGDMWRDYLDYWALLAGLPGRLLRGRRR